MLPAAPPRLSMMICWPSASDSFGVSMRGQHVRATAGRPRNDGGEIDFAGYGACGEATFDHPKTNTAATLVRVQRETRFDSGFSDSRSLRDSPRDG